MVTRFMIFAFYDQFNFSNTTKFLTFTRKAFR